MSKPQAALLALFTIAVGFVLVNAAFHSNRIEGRVTLQTFEPEEYYWTYVPIDMGNGSTKHAAMVVRDDADYIIRVENDNGTTWDIYLVRGMYVQILPGQWFDQFNTYCTVRDFDVVLGAAAPADTTKLDYKPFHDGIKWGNQHGTEGTGGLR